MTTFAHITYESLNSRQRENFNFMKLSALLADYGFITMRLSDDWNGADFIASHMDGKTFLRVQLKSRWGIFKKYEGKDLWIAFPSDGDWYLVEHDKMVDWAKNFHITETPSWQEGSYSNVRIPPGFRDLLAPYRLVPAPGTPCVDAPV